MKLPTSLRQVIEEGIKIIDDYQDEISDLVKDHDDKMQQLTLEHREYEEGLRDTIDAIRNEYEDKTDNVIALLVMLGESIEYSEDGDENRYNIESIREKTAAIIGYIQDVCTIGYARNTVS